MLKGKSIGEQLRYLLAKVPAGWEKGGPDKKGGCVSRANDYLGTEQ
jgi:hypothetical protein